MILANQSSANATAEFMADLAKSHEQELWALQRERGELNLTGVALEAYRIETELLADAKQENIALNPVEITQIRQYAAEYAITSEAIRRQREQIEFYRGTYRGFFSEMINGLREGQSVWQSFGNAVMSVVNRIIDRLMDMEGGVLDKLINLGGSLLGIASPQASLVGSVTGAMDANPGIFAKGGAFGQGGIHAFAKGGAFTNSIVSSPTLFKFAKGGALGVMGEAGDEAIMPLKRGPDGSLGVQMYETGAKEPVVVEIMAGEYFDARVVRNAEGVVARSAPTIATAGSEISERTSAYRDGRRLA